MSPLCWWWWWLLLLLLFWFWFWFWLGESVQCSLSVPMMSMLRFPLGDLFWAEESLVSATDPLTTGGRTLWLTAVGQQRQREREREREMELLAGRGGGMGEE